MPNPLRDILTALGSLYRESCPSRERWLTDGPLRLRLTPMDDGWIRIDVFDLTRLNSTTRVQVQAMSETKENAR